MFKESAKVQCIALYYAWTSDKFCSESIETILCFFDHSSPLYSLFKLTLWVSIFSLQKGRSRHGIVVTHKVREYTHVALIYAQHNSDGIEQSKGLTTNPAKLLEFQVHSHRVIKPVIK